MIDRLKIVNPEHIVLKYYRDYYSGSAKYQISGRELLNTDEVRIKPLSFDAKDW